MAKCICDISIKNIGSLSDNEFFEIRGMIKTFMTKLKILISK